MKFTSLTTDDLAALQSDREFTSSVLGLRYPDLALTGDDQHDLQILQQVFEGGPYTDDIEGELIALGTAFGDVLSRALDMQWVRVTDEHGSNLALRYQQKMIVIFPQDMIIKRVERDEQPDFAHLYEGVTSQIRKMIASGEYQ